MPIFKAPTRDSRFIINEVLKLESYGNLPGFENATADVVDTVVEELGKFVSEVVAPINLSGDQEGCKRHPDGTVTTPKGFKEAYDAFVDSGWGTLAQPEDLGGQGMPHVLGLLLEEYLVSANQSFGFKQEIKVASAFVTGWSLEPTDDFLA